MSSYNTLDLIAVKRALPHLYLTESQARTILIAVADQIADRAKQKCQKESLAVVMALVNERGGKVRVPRAALEVDDIDILSRFDDPLTGDIVFTTTHHLDTSTISEEQV